VESTENSDGQGFPRPPVLFQSIGRNCELRRARSLCADAVNYQLVRISTSTDLYNVCSAAMRGDNT